MEKKQSTKSPEVIFLIGAGASVPFSIPAMRGMFDAFMKNRKPEIDKEKKRICHLLTNELGVEKDLEEFLLAINAIIDFESTSLSQLIERIVSPKTNSDPYRKYRTKLNGHISAARLIRKSILDFMADTCFRFDQSEAERILYGFIKAASSQGYPIYTTNYDYSLEHVAREKRITIEDNFISSGHREIWNTKVSYPIGNALTVIKLHGSVTWYAADNGIVEKIYHDVRLSSDGKDVERLVVFPTRFKDIYDQHFFALYSHFLSALSAAKCLIIIGHSLRDEYLRAGIIERFRKGDLQLVIIDPDFPQILPREMAPERIGKAGKVTHVPSKFEKFSDELAYIITKSNVVDISKNFATIIHHIKSKKNKIVIKGDIRTLKAKTEKMFVAVIDAYLQPHEKPAYVRAWLAATYQHDGVKESRVSGAFLENKEIQVATGLGGMVKEQLPITLKVPEYSNWLKHAEKVTLHIAILKKNIKKPSNVQRHILAEDSRKLRYTY